MTAVSQPGAIPAAGYTVAGRTAPPILVAVKPGGDDEAPLAGARLASWQLGAPVEALAVVEPPLPLGASFGAVPPPPELLAAERAATRARVEERLRASPAATEWPVRVALGATARTIAAEAAALDARLLVVGIGRHRIADRLFGPETALQTIRCAERPVLAVPPSFRGVPFTRAVAAVDFTPASVAAARAALELLADDAVLWLVHAKSAHDLSEQAGAWWEDAYARRATELFARVRAALDVPPRVRVETVTVVGPPADALLRFAEDAHADLIAAGRHGYGFVQRFFTGSVTNALVRRASCAVLVGAEPGAADAAAIERRMRDPVWVPREQWPALFAQFSLRNAGRRARLSAPGKGAPAESLARTAAFVEAVFEPAMERLDIVLDDGAEERRLHGVERVSVQADASGRDATLYVDHARGRFLLSFLDAAHED